MKKMHVINAIDKLIRTYTDNTVNHSFLKCPLCKLFFESEGNCIGCPNITFKIVGLHIPQPCVSRGNKFKELNYRLSHNNKTLSKYWKEVRDLIYPLKESEILEMNKELQKKILNIAKRYK